MYSDKMLVMIDGRSLYNPLFSGVFWETVDVPMEDIERIEVVRGPGAVMWGPNAVNGVINIITKKAQSTQGGLVTVQGGDDDGVAGTVRGGFSPNDNVAVRVWGKGSYGNLADGSPGTFRLMDTMEYRDPSIKNLNTGSAQTGFRVDGRSGKYDSWMAQGNVYTKDIQDPLAFATLNPSPLQRLQAQTDYTGGSLQAQWTHSKSESDETVVQFSMDRVKSTYPYVTGTQSNTTFDVQKRTTAGENHEIYWGGGFQQYQDNISQGSYVTFTPNSSVYRSGDVVARDEWNIIPNRLMVSTGIRLDYSSYGHLEFQPSFRLMYTPSQKQSFWAAASRAVRAPNRYDHNIDVDAGTFNLGLGIPLKTEVIGSPKMVSEVERSLEVGYRLQSGQRWSVDASLFFSRYDRMRLLEGPSVPALTWSGRQPILNLPMTFTNAGRGQNYGGEVWAYVQVTPKWRLTPEYSYLSEKRWMPAAQTSRFQWDSRDAIIGHQGLVRSQHDLTKNLQLDLTVRARSRDTGFNLPGALLVDARLGWRPFRTSEVSIAVENLTDRRMLESLPEGPTVAIPIRRGFTLKWTQRF